MKRFKCLFLMALVAVLLASTAQAKKIFVPEILDPLDTTDDSLRTEELQWKSIDDPLWVAIHRNTAGVILPAVINLQNIPDDDIYLAANRCIRRWHDGGTGVGLDFNFNPTVFYSDFLAGINPALPYGPMAVGFDRYNLITFQDPNVVIEPGPPYYQVFTFYFTIDIDLGDYNNIPTLGNGVIYNPTTGLIDVDLNGDGIMDIHLPREEYKGGTIIDCDVAFNQLYTGYQLLPQDPDDLTPEQQQDMLGTTDIEAYMMRAMGEMLGISEIPMKKPVMGEWIESLADAEHVSNPWEKRELTLADRLLAVAHCSRLSAYSKDGPSRQVQGDQALSEMLSGTGGIRGSLYEGLCYHFPGGPAFSVLVNDDFLVYLLMPDIPIFLGVPREGTYIGPDTIPAFPWREVGHYGTSELPAYSAEPLTNVDLIGCTYSGINIKVPNGINAPEGEINSRYEFLGLPPRDDYIIFISSAPAVATQAHSYLPDHQDVLPPRNADVGGDIMNYPAEFFGGAESPTLGYGATPDNNYPYDNMVTSSYLEVATNEYGQFTVGINEGPAMLSQHARPSTSFSSVRIVKDGQTTDYTNRLQHFGEQTSPVEINDAANTIRGEWLLDDTVSVSQDLQIVGLGGPDNNLDDCFIEFTLTNVSNQPVDVGLRIMLDLSIGEIDGPPLLIDEQMVTNEREYIGEAIPSTYEVHDSIDSALFKAVGTLSKSGVTMPTRFVTALWDNIAQTDFDFTPKYIPFTGPDAWRSDGAVGIYFGMQSLNPGDSVSWSTMYGFLKNISVPESGDYEDDDPFTFETIPVEPNKVSAPINIITNTSSVPGEDEDEDEEEEIEDVPVLEDTSPKNDGKTIPIDVLFCLGADAGDIDNDGDLDIVLANGVINDQGPNSLVNRIYINHLIHPNEDDQGFYFTDETFGEDQRPGSDQDRLRPFETSIVGTYDVKLADFNGDGYLDIFFSNFSPGVGSRSGAQNQLYVNEDVGKWVEGEFHYEEFDGKPDGYFFDVTSTRLPGMLDTGPYMFVDETTRSDVGDIDSDGDIDIVVSNMDRFTEGSMGIDPEPSPPPTLLIGFSERILINHVNDRNPAARGFYFTDETLGSDYRFGGDTISQYDRVPPLLPDHPATSPSTPPNNEMDHSYTNQVVLAPIYSDNALDIYVTNRSPSIPHAYRYSGYDLVYDNVDVDGDFIPDGYFQCINYGTDDFFITLPRNSAQEPLWIGRPQGYPGHASVPPAQRDWIPQVRSNSQGTVVMDLNNSGWREIVTVKPSEIASFFDPINPPINQGIGALRARWSGWIAGTALDYMSNIITFYTNRRNYVDAIPGLTGRRRAICSGDLNLDGALDLYICNDGVGGDLGNIVPPTYNQVMLNNTFADFTDVTDTILDGNLEPDISFYSIMGDFDNDGDPDIFVCNYGEQNEFFTNRVIDSVPNMESGGDVPLFIDKTGLYMPPYFTSIANPPRVYGYSNASLNADFGDIDGDGDVDLIVANGGVQSTAGDFTVIYRNAGKPLNDGIYVYVPSGSPFPAPRQLQNYFTVFLEEFSEPGFDVQFADFDNDGDNDIFLTCAGSRNRIFFNKDVDDFIYNSVPDDEPYLGDGIFEDRSDESLPDFPVPSPEENSRKFAVGDVNGDGLIDIVIANGFANVGAPNVLLLNTRFPGPNALPGKFVAPDDWMTYPDGQPVDKIDDTMEPVVADFNADGHLDIFFANRLSYVTPKPAGFEDRCRLLFGDGNGNFTDVTDTHLPDISDDVQGVVEDIQGAVACDFDRDGDWSEDFNGDGILGHKEDQDYDGKLDWVDTNGDGKFTPDYDLFLVVRNGQNLYLTNDGSGHFTNETLDRIPVDLTNSFGLDIGDVDLDGDIDIVVANSTLPEDGSIQLLLNNGHGEFSDFSYEVPNPISVKFYENHYDFNNNSHDVKLGDIDQDGDLDMFVCNLGDYNTFPILGSNNYLFENRLIGAGFNSRMIQEVRTEGGPIVAGVQPPSGKRGTRGLTVRITGANFREGCHIDFGDGITIIGDPRIITPGVMEVTIAISSNAPVGSRTVKVTNPDGETGISKGGAFRVTSDGYPKPPIPLKDTAAKPVWSLYE